MSGQDQTTANKPTEPRLCKMGCGFFGSGATGDCCSKCWRDLQKKQGAVEAPAAPPKAKTSSPSPPHHRHAAVSEVAVTEPMDIEPPLASAPQPTTALTAASAAESPPATVSSPPFTPVADLGVQKKKKKASYKNMMASMMKQQSPERDVEKEKEALRKVTGGGAFSKIDKI